MWGLSSVADTGVGTEMKTEGRWQGFWERLPFWTCKALNTCDTCKQRGQIDRTGPTIQVWASSAEEGDTQISRNGYSYLESWDKKREKTFQNQH